MVTCIRKSKKLNRSINLLLIKNNYFMAKIERASEDVVNLFEEVRGKTSIPHWIQFEVLSNEKQKELYKITKLNDVVEVLGKGGR